MASFIDAFNDALSEKHVILKMLLFAIPVYISVNLYLSKNMVSFYVFLTLTLILFLVLMSIGINNICSNKHEIFTFNIIKMFFVLIRMIVAVGPAAIILFGSGFIIVKNVVLPFDVPNINLYFQIFVWAVVGTILLTSYLSFSKNSNIVDSYNFAALYEATSDVLINVIFLIPQLVIFNGIIVGFVWYVMYCINIPVTHHLFLFYCSVVAVFNVAILASFFAQLAYDVIKGKDDEYRDKFYMSGCKSDNYDKYK